MVQKFQKAINPVNIKFTICDKIYDTISLLSTKKTNKYKKHTSGCSPEHSITPIKADYRANKGISWRNNKTLTERVGASGGEISLFKQIIKLSFKLTIKILLTLRALLVAAKKPFYGFLIVSGVLLAGGGKLLSLEWQLISCVGGLMMFVIGGYLFLGECRKY